MSSTGIIAASSVIKRAAPTPPSNQAVSFIGTVGPGVKCGLKLPALSCTNNGFFGWAGWFLTDWYPTTGTSFPNIFVTDPNVDFVPNFHQNGSTQWEEDVGVGVNGSSINVGAADSLAYLPAGVVWHHVISAWDVNHANPSKIGKIFVDGVDATANFNSTAAAYNFGMNGKDFWIGDDGFGNSWVGAVYDFSLWPGISLLTGSTISSTTLQLFRTVGGAPVAPSVAIAALGSPAVMLTGGVSGFLANSLGTNGPLQVPALYDSPVNIAGHP
jgi:hypothetical protein